MFGRVYISSTHVPGWLTTHMEMRASVACSISTNGSGQLMEIGLAPKILMVPTHPYQHAHQL